MGQSHSDNEGESIPVAGTASAKAQWWDQIWLVTRVERTRRPGGEEVHADHHTGLAFAQSETEVTRGFQPKSDLL